MPGYGEPVCLGMFAAGQVHVDYHLTKSTIVFGDEYIGSGLIILTACI